MTRSVLRIATRKSPLALWQARHVADLLRQQWPELNIELLPMLTSGDQFIKDKLQSLGGKGLFVKELEEALLDKRADFAVHSMKDVPADLPAGLIITAICERDNPLDAFVSQRYAHIRELPVNSVIGTSSLRRQSQLLAWRPDLSIKTLRGNINTRLARLEQGDYDAIILAAAGLMRMGMDDVMNDVLDDRIMLPACGQGALGIECREDDLRMQELLAPLNHSLTATCVKVERRVNARLGGNCHVPLAVYCQESAAETLLLRAKVLSLDGKTLIEDQQQGHPSEAFSLADTCANRLLANGAEQLLHAS
ncbi:hydroxymethylbilane synthase [Legionella sp. CNM-4043-24]|uniref:hydroxymethylbilane synthase n=1 Tax=Legionella sp. CNM-4043-24 TaxID=3421646 RepID=UPI00403A8031